MSTTKKVSLKDEIKAYALVALGSLLFAVGDVMFVNPYHLAPGGVYGLANVFNALWGWKISVAGVCMDIPLLLIGTWILGPRFGAKTIVSVVLIPIFTYFLETYYGYAPLIHDGIYGSKEALTSFLSYMDGDIEKYFIPDFFLNTVVAGIIYGVAIGVIFRAGATSGGSDIISMIIHKYTKISLGVLVLIVDSCISLTTLIIGNIRLPIYSIILIYIESKIIDLIVEGFTTYKTVFIVTDRIDEVKNFILNELKRGGTCFPGLGLYQGQERKMIYVTLDRTDLVKLKANLRHLDPNAFVNVIESSEIMGLGFKALPEE
ncbi:MAG: YitT family protein [Bacteroidales bacterium]|nr:YitT family protein [Bacteroidales bacterium]